MSSLTYPGVLATLWCLIVLFCPRPLRAEILTLETVLAEAQQHGFDLKIARQDLEASRAQVDEAQADYYPRLSLRFGNEYVHAFARNGDVVSVGDAIIANDASGYKHSLIVGASYNLFDFGLRRLTLENAGRQERIARLGERQVLRELRQELLARYADALKLQKQIQAMELMFDRQRMIFQLNKELREAGTIGREPLGSAALALAEMLGQRDELQLRYQDALGRLAFYTRQSYAEDKIQLADLAPPETTPPTTDLDDLPELLIYRQQIESKQAELAMVMRSMLPKLTLSGSYRMFGSDENSFDRSFSDLSSRDASVTVYLDWPLFEGFASLARKRRLHHEITRLGYQQQKKKAELQQELASRVNACATYGSTQPDRQRQLAQIEQEQKDAERLAAQQVSDQISFHTRMIGLIRQRLELELRQVDQAATALALAFLSGGTP